jgi:hypothetical protein
MKVPDMGFLGFSILLLLGCLAGAGIAYIICLFILLMR